MIEDDRVDDDLPGDVAPPMPRSREARTPGVNTDARPPTVAGRPMASRGLRFAGALIDGVIMMIVILPVMYLLGFFDPMIEAFQAIGKTAPGEPPPEVAQPEFDLGMTVLGFVIGQVLFFALHGYLLFKHGQTIAKKMLGMQIVNEHGRVPSFGKLASMRYVVMGLIQNVPGIGGLVSLINALLIFRANQRCLHDDLAGTYVVTAASTSSHDVADTFE